MKRIASLDLLRGIAAFAVAIPHYLLLYSEGLYPLSEATAIAAVEVFFVLSGFVLAPQILTEVVPGQISSLKIFLVRRWMRTIPPYLLALTAIAILTSKFLTPDFVRYAFYLQNLFRQSNVTDFFPVAWSLSVEEWFYVSFAPLLFLLVRLTGRRTWSFAVVFAAGFIAAVTVARLYFESTPDWNAEIRRVTVFRVDAVAWGFLLYVATSVSAVFAASRLKTTASIWASLLAAMVSGALCIALITRGDSAICRSLFPFVATAFGGSAVFLFRQSDCLIRSHRWQQFGIYTGHISYSIYLFHLPLALVLKPAMDHLPLPLQLFVFSSGLIALTTAVWFFFERPILAARPKYREKSSPPAMAPRKTIAHRPAVAASVLLAICGLTIGVLSPRYYDASHARLFYLMLIGASSLMFASAWLSRVRALVSSALTLLFVTTLLPGADRLASLKAATPPTSSEQSSDIVPAYSFRTGHANPAAFTAWWTRYVAEWTKLGGGKTATEAPDPKGILPFVLVKNSTGKFFDSEIHINNLGFRGPDIDPEKGNKFRIFALGESPTFGPTLRPGEHPWPEVMGSLVERRLICDRPIEVINAGTEAYNLVDNLERLRRDILPLKPDIVVSYHGSNGFGPLFDPSLTVAYQPPKREHIGPSPLLDALRYNLKTTAYIWRPRAPTLYSESVILNTRYANAYRQLLEIGREQGYQTVLATLSLAVNETSPARVKEFYEAMWGSVEPVIIQADFHNKMIETLAKESGALLVDTTPALDGHWDEDLFLDMVHFTQKGNDRMASTILEGIMPILQRDLNCRPRSN